MARPRRRKPVWRRADAHALLPLSRDWVQTRRALDRQAEAGHLPAGSAALCSDSDPRAMCEWPGKFRACPTWSVHLL
jgi:hypothetical protein